MSDFELRWEVTRTSAAHDNAEIRVLTYRTKQIKHLVSENAGGYTQRHDVVEWTDWQPVPIFINVI